MEEIPFTVSARTAKLIGQENFATADGAIIELVKNCYDADSTLVLVVFDIKYPNTPVTLTSNEYQEFSKDENFNKSAYTYQNGHYNLESDISSEIKANLFDFFQFMNSIYIIDNGEGMTEKVIREKWMKIGTDNKLIDFKSEKGRIKTGAKGIGRFALDRLGKLSEMKTLSKKSKQGYKWIMNWEQFDDKSKTIDQITAQLLPIENFNLETIIFKEIEDERIKEVLQSGDFELYNGTIIKISHLKDLWDTINIEKLYNSLSALVPPQELAVFKLYMFRVQSIDLGEVTTAFFNEYDYRVKAKFYADELNVHFEITRQEQDLKIIETEFKEIFTNRKPPFDFQTLKDKSFNYDRPINKILKWRKEESTELLKRVGDFEMLYFFTKLDNPNNKEIKKYGYKRKDYSSIKKTFERFGGIKIYRDHFRVRPYGEPGDDWLDLGKRQASSPASAGQRVGDWRVRSKQIAGTIDISRVNNPEIQDKSDRSALVENDVFETFKSIIIGIINEFEVDRSKILNPFFEKARLDEQREKEEKLKNQAEELAKKIIEERNKNKNNINDNEVLSSTTGIIEESLRNKKDEENIIENEKDTELKLMRSLASVGLIVSSFDHELKSISNNLLPRIKYLNKHSRSLIPNDNLKDLPENRNPFILIEQIRKDHEKLKGWLDYSLSSIKIDKRKRENLNFGDYFIRFKKNWKFVLLERNVSLNLIGNSSKENIIRAFEVDMDSIFNNLFNNSLEAFKLRREKYNREINISWTNDDSCIEINYSDNGVGLSDVFDDFPEEIFEPFITTKKDRTGKEIGTGLGMYILKKVIDEYDGDIEIFKPKKGFGIKLYFNKRAGKK